MAKASDPLEDVAAMCAFAEEVLELAEAHGLRYRRSKSAAARPKRKYARRTLPVSAMGVTPSILVHDDNLGRQ